MVKERDIILLGAVAVGVVILTNPLVRAEIGSKFIKLFPIPEKTPEKKGATSPGVFPLEVSTPAPETLLPIVPTVPAPAVIPLPPSGTYTFSRPGFQMFTFILQRTPAGDNVKKIRGNPFGDTPAYRITIRGVEVSVMELPLSVPTGVFNAFLAQLYLTGGQAQIGSPPIPAELQG